MAKTDQNFDMWSGESKDLIFTVVDSNNAIVDLTGAVVKWNLYKNPTGTPDITKTSLAGGGITLTSPITGQFKVSISANESKILTGVYSHAAQITDVRGFVTIVATGNVNMIQAFKFQ